MGKEDEGLVDRVNAEDVTQAKVVRPERHSSISYEFLIEMFSMTDSLSRGQLWHLVQFYREGIDTRPRGINTQGSEQTSVLSFYYNGRHICNAHGNMVLPTLYSIFTRDVYVKFLIREIRECYLPEKRKK
ncbi:hypothetical protein KY363_08265 [Candidatus Woesearchaeota archaeon]|nr:hypothetical protein [Candidatus Woesearchaeota archaeon]